MKNFSVWIFACLICPVIGHAQLPENHELYKLIVKQDSLLFNVGFNQCNMAQFESLLSDDFEFYHDISGIQTSKQNNIAQFKAGICGNPNFKSRRELVPGSIQVYPLKDNGEIYGLLQEGSHKFFETFDHKDEVAGSVAKFTHLWIKEGDVFRIRRVISYDHQQQFNSTISKATIDLSPYVGQYKAPTTGDIFISIKDNNLFLEAGSMQAPLQHMEHNRFEIVGAGLAFEFLLDANQEAVKFKVIENNVLVEEATKQK